MCNIIIICPPGPNGSVHWRDKGSCYLVDAGPRQPLACILPCGCAMSWSVVHQDHMAVSKGVISIPGTLLTGQGTLWPRGLVTCLFHHDCCRYLDWQFSQLFVFPSNLFFIKLSLLSHSTELLRTVICEKQAPGQEWAQCWIGCDHWIDWRRICTQETHSMKGNYFTNNKHMHWAPLEPTQIKHVSRKRVCFFNKKIIVLYINPRLWDD